MPEKSRPHAVSKKSVLAGPATRRAGNTPDRSQVSPARRAAFEILERLETTSAHSDDLLHGPALATLSQVDRDLTTALVLGVLRWQIALDARLRGLLSRPDAGLAGPVVTALRLGALQLLHMDRIPAHAALNESVELVRGAGHAYAAGMVNAVLRRLASAGAPRRPLVESTPMMADRLGHPLWIAERWVRRYGRSVAEAVCTFDQAEPGCSSTFIDSNNFAAPLMDAGSRLVAELAAVACVGERTWDTCAAPGGKTIVLANRLPETAILATDTSPKRLQRLSERLKRELGGKSIVDVKQADAAALPASLGTFNLILCDVPCSGTGTLARNPEIRHRLEPADISRQARRQRDILRGALARLRNGGRLIYSTCSLESEECEQVVEAILEETFNEFRLLPVAPLLRKLQHAGVLQTEESQWSRWVDRDFLRTLPGYGFEGDGFFAAVLERA